MHEGRVPAEGIGSWLRFDVDKVLVA